MSELLGPWARVREKTMKKLFERILHNMLLFLTMQLNGLLVDINSNIL